MKLLGYYLLFGGQIGTIYGFVKWNNFAHPTIYLLFGGPIGHYATVVNILYAKGRCYACHSKKYPDCYIAFSEGEKRYIAILTVMRYAQ